MKGLLITLALLLSCSYAIRLHLETALIHAQENSFSELVGSQMTLVSVIKDVEVPYAYWSFGLGNNQKETYTLALYKVENLDNNEVLCFIQKGFDVSETKTITKDFQYGYDNGVLFFVEQDATRRSHNIYQWRFMKAAGELPQLKQALYGFQQAISNFIQTKIGLPLNFEWIAGEALKNF